MSICNVSQTISKNPDRFEPDCFFNGTPFEFTIASDSKKRHNFIQQFFWGRYSSEDVEQDVFSYITERICDKASKKYSVDNVHLCILCLLDLSIDAGVFSNVFIIFSDPCAKWWVYDVLTDNRSFYEITDADSVS